MEASNVTQNSQDEIMATRRELLYECSIFRLTCLLCQDPENEFQNSVNKHRYELENTWQSVLNDEDTEEVFCWFLMNHINMKEQKNHLGATEIKDLKHIIPELLIFCHENGTKEDDGSADATECIFQFGPLWETNKEYYKRLTLEKISERQGGYGVKEHDEGWTFETLNQVKADLFFKRGNVDDDPEFQPWTIVWKRIVRQEKFYCGSVRENVATTLLDHPAFTDTDFDQMICAPIPGTLHDILTRPGYTRILSGAEQNLETDANNFVLSSGHNLKYLQISEMNIREIPFIPRASSSISGPAIAYATNPLHVGKTMDQVYGFYCLDRLWPGVAEEWRRRDRTKLSGWPPRALIDRVISHGTYIVPVAHKNSDNPDIEWRYSFSKPEIDLMLSITQRQRKCYMLTKRLCQLVFSGFKIFCSYFIKTSFFWMLEEMPYVYWDCMTMDDLVDFLLDKMIFYFAELKLPNYFIKQSNIIDHLPQEHIATVRQKLKSLRLRGKDGLPQYVVKDVSFYWINLTVKPRHKPSFSTLSVPQHNVVFLLLFKKELVQSKSPEVLEIFKKYWGVGQSSILWTCPDSESSFNLTISDLFERLSGLGLIEMLGISAKFSREEIRHQFLTLMSAFEAEMKKTFKTVNTEHIR